MNDMTKLICIGGALHGQRMEQNHAGYTARPYQKKDGIGGTVYIYIFNISNDIGDTQAVSLIKKLGHL